MVLLTYKQATKGTLVGLNAKLLGNSNKWLTMILLGGGCMSY